MNPIDIKLPAPKPDFGNLLRVLSRENPARPTLFEFFLNDPLYDLLNQGKCFSDDDGLGGWRRRMHAFWKAGYDYVVIQSTDFYFPADQPAHLSTISQYGSGPIHDRASYEAYAWLNPDDFDDSRLETLGQELPEGMKLIICGPCGVLENLISLVGFEQMCFMASEDPELLDEISLQIGSRLVKYYQSALQHASVGAIISNDDWGFNMQTMLDPATMRRCIFPWHKKIAEAAHAAGKPAILHSCGNLSEVWEDIIEDMQFDGKHSFEDKIQPVEQAYEQFGSRIAILGGFDLDFICRETPDQVKARVRDMLRQVGTRGGFAVGTGNSVPSYVPVENYLAMIDLAL